MIGTMWRWVKDRHDVMRANQAMAKALAVRLHAIAEQTHAARTVGLVDAELMKTIVNPTLVRLLGYTRSMSWLGLRPRDDAKALMMASCELANLHAILNSRISEGLLPRGKDES